MGLAGGVGVAARPNSDANGLDSREPGATFAGAPGRGRGGNGGLFWAPAFVACGRGGSGSEGWCDVKENVGYVGVEGGGLGEVGIGRGGDCGVGGSDGCLGMTDTGRGGSELKATFRVDGSCIALNTFEEMSIVDRIVNTSLRDSQERSQCPESGIVTIYDYTYSAMVPRIPDSVTTGAS